MDMTITLSVDQWNVVLAALCAQPYKDVATIIDSIKKQGDEQTPNSKPAVE
jgi:hypothetical protein